VVEPSLARNLEHFLLHFSHVIALQKRSLATRWFYTNLSRPRDLTEPPAIAGSSPKSRVARAHGYSLSRAVTPRAVIPKCDSSRGKGILLCKYLKVGAKVYSTIN
jgi:hypothetical protein